MSNVNEIKDPPLPERLSAATVKLKAKTLVKGDASEGIEDFYAYDLVNAETGMIGSIDLYVAVTPQATAEFHELQPGQLFKLIPTK